MSKSKTKIGIYLCAILMMGVIAVSSNLANIMAAFPDTNPNTIVSYMISVPCFVIIIMSLVTGKLMEKKMAPSIWKEVMVPCTLPRSTGSSKFSATSAEQRDMTIPQPTPNTARMITMAPSELMK